MSQICLAQNMLDNLFKSTQLKLLVFGEAKYSVFILDTTSFPFL